MASLLAAYGVFAIGYAARPIGGALFGHIGDKLGRKPTLILSVVVMGASTFCIGVMPDHAQIGTAAAWLLTVLRVLQGLSVGGEFTGSIVFVGEHAPDQRRGFQAAWPQFGTVLGFLVGSGVGALTSDILGDEVMHDWGWRIPFLLGAVIAILALLIRRRLTEPPALETAGRVDGSPVIAAFRNHWRPILRMMCMILFGSIGFYMVFVYAESYEIERLHLTTGEALDINSLGLLAMLGATMPAAYLSDRIGRKPLLYAVTIGTITLSWPLWWLMHQESLAMILAGQIGFGVLFGGGFACFPATMIEMLPAPVRCSGVSIGYNLCLGIFGGTTPLISTYLTKQTGDPFAPIYYLIAMATVSLIVVIRLRETAGKPLP